jgi:hypothetical protein
MVLTSASISTGTSFESVQLKNLTQDLNLGNSIETFFAKLLISLNSAIDSYARSQFYT